MDNKGYIGPVIVTATGGSGTRVVAEILEHLGCFLGGNLNYAKDNMDFAYCLTGNFTEIFKDFPFDGDLGFYRERLALFEKCFFQEPLAIDDYWNLLRIGTGFAGGGKRWAVATRPLKDRLENLLKVFRIAKPDPVPDGALYWGAKDPDAMFLIKPLVLSYPDLKVIHIVRDGRDMAVSTQQKSMRYYGPLFGLSREYSPKSSYEFWARSNLWFRRICDEILPENSYCFVQFEKLCRNPKAEIDRLAEFVSGVEPTESTYSIPREISSMGRWKKQPEQFAEIDQAALREFGYFPSGEK